jgi:hypothetical protein
MKPYDPLAASMALDPRFARFIRGEVLDPRIARIISGGSIVERPTADRPEVVRTVVTDRPAVSSRCICAHPGQHATCAPCRCTKETK